MVDLEQCAVLYCTESGSKNEGKVADIYNCGTLSVRRAQHNSFRAVDNVF